MKKTPIDAELCRNLFQYDDGKLRYRVNRRPCMRIGDEAGTPASHGYRQVWVNGKAFKTHRIIWAMHHGDPGNMEVDHINGIKDDNRIENLRLATRAQNNRNMKSARKHAAIGLLGVSWFSAGQKYRAQIQVAGKKKHLGYFETELQAGAAYAEASKLYFGEFHGGS